MAKRAVNGVLLLDKSEAITSNAALQRARWLLRAKKGGHTGTLDPLATGLLPLCFGEATKFSQYLLSAEKTYLVTAKLGVGTDSGDAEGQIISRGDVPALSGADLSELKSHFLGKQQQLPPMYSALKVQGKKLYEYAREGLEVPLTAREIEILSLEGLKQTDDLLSFEVSCTKGTYIRSLVVDIGEYLGTPAHVTTLRRTAVGHLNLDIENAVTLAELDTFSLEELERRLLPVSSLLEGWVRIELSADQADSLRCGRAIPGIEQEGSETGLVAIWSGDGLLGIGVLDEFQVLRPKRLVSSNAEGLEVLEQTG